MHKRRWGIAFLGATAAVVISELWASWDRDPDTRPWTDFIVANIPEEVTASAVGALSAWLPLHFSRRYTQKRLK